jgi:hypothetical protein
MHSCGKMKVTSSLSGLQYCTDEKRKNVLNRKYGPTDSLLTSLVYRYIDTTEEKDLWEQKAVGVVWRAPPPPVAGFST